MMRRPTHWLVPTIPALVHGGWMVADASPGSRPLSVTGIPPSGGGVVEGRLFSLDSVFDEVVPLAV